MELTLENFRDTSEGLEVFIPNSDHSNNGFWMQARLQDLNKLLEQQRQATIAEKEKEFIKVIDLTIKETEESIIPDFNKDLVINVLQLVKITYAPSEDAVKTKETL